MVSENQRSLPSDPLVEVEHLLQKEVAALGGHEEFATRAAQVDALYARGLLWLAETAERYGVGRIPSRISGLARPPNVIQPFGVTGLDDLLPEGGFLPGTAHELFVETSLKNAPSAIISTIGATVHRSILRRSLVHRSLIHRSLASSKLAVWIGKSVWPTPHFLDHLFHTPCGDTALCGDCNDECSHAGLSQSLFIDPPNEKAVFWAIDTALRSPAVGVVIASLPKMSFALSRRLLLAARTGNSIALFYRPVRRGTARNNHPTSLTTQWIIRPKVSASAYPRWDIELLKYKGSPPHRTTWSVELCGSDDDQNVPLHLSSDVADRCVETADTHHTDRTYRGGHKRA